MIESIENDLLFLRFGQVRFVAPEYEIEMCFLVLNSSIKGIIGSVEYLDAYTNRVLTIWAPYRTIGETVVFDLFKKGKWVSTLQPFAREKTVTVDSGDVSYFIYGRNTDFIDELNTTTSRALLNQNFAYFQLKDASKKDAKYWILPCAEIYNAYFGQWESAMIEATFDENNFPLYNKEHTVTGQLERNSQAYIKLKKQFTEASVLSIYRMFFDKVYEDKYIATSKMLRGDCKYLYSEFPFEGTNDLKITYIKLDSKTNFIVQVLGIRSGFDFPEDIEWETDNTPGQSIGEKTKVMRLHRNIPIIKGASPDLPKRMLPRNPAAGLNVIRKRKFENLDKPARLIKTVKPEKKTVSERSSVSIHNIESQTYRTGSKQDSRSIGTAHIPEKLYNDIEFSNTLADVLKMLQDRKEITSLGYYKGIQQHPLMPPADYYGNKNWPHLTLKPDKPPIYRNCGVIEFMFKECQLYIIEIQKKTKREGFCTGLFYTNGFRSLSNEEFDLLVRKIVSCNGILKKVLSEDSEYRLGFLYGKCLYHSDNMGQRLMKEMEAMVG